MNKARILLVDDDTAFRNGIERFLRAQGCEIRVAATGEAALEMVRQEVPNLVLLDLYLPFMNGLKALREIHKIDERIPVLMLTCEDDEEYRRLAAKFGALEYLTKPITLINLMAYLETRLKSPNRTPPTSLPPTP